MSENIKVGDMVSLTVDLTRYHKNLVVGAKGIAGDYGVGGMYAYSQPDRFVVVYFNYPIGTWDILRSSLKKI